MVRAKVVPNRNGYLKGRESGTAYVVLPDRCMIWFMHFQSHAWYQVSNYLSDLDKSNCLKQARGN